jgi:hypothetical protein
VDLLADRLPLRPLRAMDLGTGTAANIRYLAPRLRGQQSWFAVDNDPELLAHQPSVLRGPTYDCQLSATRADLARELQLLPWTQCQLVTASALLDLVSASWLDSLAIHCHAVAATVLFALNYDGRMQCWPGDPEDEWLRAVVNEHQHGDKGFGSALGPSATDHAVMAFGNVGYQTRVAGSDWLIAPEERALQVELINGWLSAAHELAPGEARRISHWGARRLAHVAAGTSRLLVGHRDFIAWPATAA